MERKKPISGEFYQHFKGKLYQIKMLAKDSATKREVVVYQALYAPYECFTRDLEEFMALVDKEKYPEETQKYCFRQVVFQKPQPSGNEESISQMPSSKEPEISNIDNADAVHSISDETLVKALKSGQPDRYLENRITEEEIAHRGMIQLLDAETFHEKRQIFIGLKQYVNKHMLNNIAVALDIVLEEGDVDAQYDSIMQCMAAFEHYEGGRLR